MNKLTDVNIVGLLCYVRNDPGERCVDLEIFGVKAMGQFFKWTAGAFSFGLAEFFADPYQQCVVLIEKLRVLRQIRLE